MKKKLHIMIMAIVMLLLICPNTAYASDWNINQTKVTMNIGDEIDLDLTGTESKGRWTSYNVNNATVDQDGIVKAVRKGKTTIAVRIGLITKKCSVNVVDSSIKLNKKSATIYTGGTSTNTVQLKVTVKGASQNVTWTSSDESIAIVDSKGKVTSVSEGIAIITATANGKSASTTITVKTSNISLNMGEMQLSTNGTGSSIKLTPSITGSNQKVKWTTSDSKVATVSNGKVTGKKEGTATITATANGVSASCNVTVVGGLISINEEKVILYEGEIKQLKTNAGKKDVVTWESSNPSVATVDNKGKVTSVSDGVTIISVTANGKTDSCEVAIKKTSTSIEESVVLLETKGTDKTYSLNTTVVGRKSAITWKTSDKNVVTVINGKLTAKKAGTATITATANGVSDSVEVTVKEYNPTIKINQSEYTLYTKKGNTLNLKAIVDGASKKVTWTSSNPTVADIKNGKVTAKKAGTTLITATANGVSAECFITVNESKVILGATNIWLKKGEKAELPVDIIGASQSVKYATTNSKVATVKNGVITAKGIGNADIKVTANGITSICHIAVSDCEHIFEEGIITKEATCSEEGIKEIHCANCEYFYNETIPVIDHTWKESETIPATCLNSGIITYTCEVCLDTKQEVTPTTEHSYGEWEVVTEATEDIEGIEKQVCINCGDEQTRMIPKKEHEHTYEAVITAPTCTEDGYTTYTCKCGETYTDALVAALGHTWGKWQVTKEATETEEGSRKRICSVCSEEETEAIPVLGHEHVYESVVTEPTCTAQGYTTYICACGDSYIDNYIDKLEHDCQWHVIKEVTCISNGEEHLICINCGHVENITIIGGGSIYHKWEYVITKDPGTAVHTTVDEFGERVRTCTYCNETKTEAIINIDASAYDETDLTYEPKEYLTFISDNVIQVCGTFCDDMAYETFEMVNELRTSLGLNELRWFEPYENICNIRGAEIAIKFSHTRPNGEYAIYTNSAGMEFKLGENIAGGHRTAEEVFNGWYNSQGHYENMIKDRYTKYYAACFQDENGVCFWVQLFKS